MDETPSSPKWKKPSDVMKRHRKKKRLSQQQSISNEKASDKLTDVFNVNNSFLQTQPKLRNPFSQESRTESPSKRKRLDSFENTDITEEHVLFSILGNVEKVWRPCPAQLFQLYLLDLFFFLVGSQTVLQMKLSHVLTSVLFQAQENETKSSLMIDHERSTSSQPSFLLDDDDSKSQFDFIEKFVKANQQRVQTKTPSSPKQNDLHSNDAPVDWSLKVKLRVLSEKSLLWCTQVRTAEEAKGITQFLTGSSDTQIIKSKREKKGKVEKRLVLHRTNKDHLMVGTKIPLGSLVPQVQVQDSERGAHFQEAGLYWIYPSLPWMKLFPRIIPDTKLRTSSAALLDNLIQSALIFDWTESFTSAFHQLRAQHCPYFYVCTHQFSVLFRAPGVAGQSTISAVLTPTTRGMRESLKGEDITFSMPLLDRRKNSTNPDLCSENNSNQESEQTVTTRPVHEEEDDDELIETDEGASVWLESMGLDKNQFPSLDPNKVKIQREGFKVIDNRPESTVYVTGADVQGLFNYLLNCRSCVATSGPQAGLPPTILAPSAFKGATLKSHKVKHSLVKQMDEKKNIKPVHILEIIGPVLPHHVSNYKSLFHNTQAGEFTLNFNTYEPSIPFNIPLGQCETDSNKSALRNQLGMKHGKFDCFFSNMPLDDRLVSVREIQCSEGRFSFLV